MSNTSHISTTTLKTPLSVKLIALAVGLSTAGALAQSGAQVNTALLGDVDYGIICPVGDKKQVPAEGTTLGYITERQSSQTIRLTTQTIPLVKGIGFGIRSTNISGRTLAPVEITVTHPPFPGHSSTRDVWLERFEIGNVNFNFFTFEFPFEMQTGQWTFTARQFGDPLFEINFQVVDAKTVPQLAALCAGPALTS